MVSKPYWWLCTNAHWQILPSTLAQKLIIIFQHHLIPGTFVSCDESRISSHDYFCGLLSFNSDKPARWALEFLTLNDSSRYLYDFTLPKEMSARNGLIYFAKRLSTLGKRFHITADKRFSNLEQAQKLHDLKIQCTLACNRRSKPQYLFSEGLARGLPHLHTRMAKSNKFVAACYHRAKHICLISSWFSLENLPIASAKARAPLLKHYDDTKRYTDQFNQLVSKYHFHHRHNDIKNTILIGLFEFALTNAYIIYINNVQTPISHREFLLSVAKSLLQQ